MSRHLAPGPSADTGVTLPVVEKFVSLQGEGPLAGQCAAFIRLAHCNLDCGAYDGASFACDTPYSWDWRHHDRLTEIVRTPIDQLVAWVRSCSTDLVVITGGEPMLHQRRLVTLAEQLSPARVQIETNATIAPSGELTAAISLFVASPKLANSGVPQTRRIVPAALTSLQNTAAVAWKFVASSVTDLDEIDALAQQHRLSPVWVMPEGTDTYDLLARQRDLVDHVVSRGWNLSSRLHVLLWGDQRGC